MQILTKSFRSIIQQSPSNRSIRVSDVFATKAEELILLFQYFVRLILL